MAGFLIFSLFRRREKQNGKKADKKHECRFQID